jgi:hypothetical protein
VQIDRRDGTSNLYSLLQCEEVEAPTAPTKAQSPHHSLIKFFHEQTQTHRGVTLKWSPRDTAHLKRALQTGILTQSQLEQLMLYFLASPQFKRFTPSMATFFSAGIFNGLQNTMKNDPGFFKELYSYEVRSGRKAEGEKQTSEADIPMRSMSEMVKQLSEKLSMNRETTYVR